MKNKILTILLTWCSLVTFGQSNITNEIEALLTPETVGQAESKVDEYLQKDPDNVDALVMKGNVIYYKYTIDKPQLALIANTNESIYDNTIGYLEDPVIILPVEVADKITGISRGRLS